MFCVFREKSSPILMLTSLSFQGFAGACLSCDGHKALKWLVEVCCCFALEVCAQLNL